MTQSHNHTELEYKPEQDACQENLVHGDIVQSVAARLPEDSFLCDIAEFFKVFGDTTRIKILCALFESELCVCDLASLLSMTQSAISHQLRMLKAMRLVKYRREGKSVFYTLADDHVRTIFDQGCKHIAEKG